MRSGCWAVRAVLRRHYIITEIDSQTGALFARSTWGGEFGGRVAFADLAGKQTSFTGDRTEFLGRNGTLANVLRRWSEAAHFLERLEQVSIRAQRFKPRLNCVPAREAEIVFFLGQAENREQSARIAEPLSHRGLGRNLPRSRVEWDDVLGTVQVTTPDPAMDFLMNRWLLYQTLACRVWARAAFYQLSGAYGFRDQLQDVMALCVAKRGDCA